MPWRSREISIGSSPNSPFKVFWLCPLRVLPALFSTGSCLLVPEMIGHLGLQRTFEKRLGQLFEQALLTQDIFGLLVIGQQFVDQLVDRHGLLLSFRWPFTQFNLYPRPRRKVRSRRCSHDCGPEAESLARARTTDLSRPRAAR